MDIIKILEQAKAQIKAEEQSELNIIKEKVNREMQPKNQELESLKNEEINKITLAYQNSRSALTEQYNKQLVALQEKYEADKNEVAQATERKKADLLNSYLSSATYEVTLISHPTIPSITGSSISDTDSCYMSSMPRNILAWHKS